MNYEKELQDLLFDMIALDPKYMFYGLFFSEINVGFVEDDHMFKTACIGKSKSGNVPQMYINKKFWREACSEKSQKKALVLHELMHMIFDHITEYSTTIYPDKKISNLAFDMYINQQISEKFPTDEKGETQGIFITTYPELKLKANESSLHYYNILADAKDKKNQSSGRGEDSLAGPKGNGMGTSGCKNLDGQLDSGEDIHIGWDELTEGMSEMEKDLLKKEIASIAQRAVEDTEKSRGTIPAYLAEVISKNLKLQKPIMSWRELFKRFVGSALSSEQYDTRKRPNFRFEDAAAHKIKTKVKCVVLCDSSGSMSDTDMDEINSQLHQIWKAGGSVDFATWDAECEDTKPYDGRLKFERTKCGGTRIGCAIEHVNENASRKGWNFAVIGTDGHTESDPPTCKIPTIIVITKSGTMSTIKTKHKMIKIN